MEGLESTGIGIGGAVTDALNAQGNQTDGEPSAGVATGGASSWDAFYARFTERQAATERMRMDYELGKFLRSPEARDPERKFAYLDDYSAKRWGVKSEHGSAWTKERTPFDNADQYADAMVGMVVRGYEAIASPEYNAWMAAKSANNREEMIRLAGIDTRRAGFGQPNAQSVYGPAPMATVSDKTDEEIDGELADYDAKMEGQNFIGVFRAYDAAYHFTDDEKSAIEASLAKGDGLPEEYAGWYATLVHDDPKRAAVIGSMVDLARRRQSAWWRDNVWETAKDGFGRIKDGLANFGEDYFAPIIAEGEILSDIRSSEGRSHWNDAERAEFTRLRDAYMGRGATESGAARTAQRKVDEMCARRLVREAMPREEQIRERRERLVIEDALKYKQTAEYGYLSRTVAGIVSTLPYMAMTALPYVGFAANVASQFENVRDDIIMGGGDPDEAIGMQAVAAFAWAGIEKLQFEGLFGRSLSGLERKTLLARIMRTTLANGKMREIGRGIRSVGGEVGGRLLSESITEGMQDGLEGGEREWFRTHDADAVVKRGISDAWDGFYESLGTMGVLSAVGTARNVAAARRDSLSRESLVDYATAQLRAQNVLRNTTVRGETDANAASEGVGRMVSACTDAMRRHVEDGSGAVAALDEIREKFGLDDGQLRAVADWLDLRENLVEAARYADTDEQAMAVARFAGGVLPIGRDTTYNPVDLFRLINPDIRVEKSTVVDPNAAPAGVEETAGVVAARRAVASAEEEVAAAKVGSARRGAERKLRKARKALAREEEGARMEPGKMDVLRVSVPIGADGRPRTFTVEETRTAPDVTTRGFAASVEQAMSDAVGTATPDGDGAFADGRGISLDEFRAMPVAEKVKVAVTADQYLSLTPEERETYLTANDIRSGGDFRMLDESGREVFGTDALVRVIRAVGAAHVAVGGNWTLSHEYSHAVTRFARDAGLVGEDTAATMRRLFGGPRDGVDELWNEEAAGDAFAEWLRGKFDFRRYTEAERRAAMGLLGRIWDTAKSVMRLGGIRPPDTPLERSQRERAVDAAFEAVRRGDFRGMDVYAGIDFADEGNGSGEGENGAEVANDSNGRPQESEAEGKRTDASPREKGGAEVATDGKKTRPGGAISQKTEKKSANRQESGTEKTSNRQESGTRDAYAEGYAAALAEIRENPSAFLGSLPVRVGGTKRTVFTPGYKMQAEAEAVWVPLADLVESTDDRSIQMRDRSRFATDEQIIELTRPDVFQPLALFPGTRSDDGAPIVGGGMRIISGHGRKRVLQRLAELGRYGEYLDAINAECARQGLPTAPDGMANPVLVLRITGGLDSHEKLAEFAELSNRSGILERSVTELAESDSRTLTPKLMRLYHPDASGNLLAASNRKFMTAFLKGVGSTGLTNADGTPTKEAALRVQRAFMTAIFGNGDRVRELVGALLERDRELSLGMLSNALMRSAGDLLAMNGRFAAYDITPDIREAALLYIGWRSEQQRWKGLTLNDHLANLDFFTSATQMQKSLARLLERGVFGKVIEGYAKQAAMQQADDQGMLSVAEPLTPLQVLSATERSVANTDSEGNRLADDDPRYATPPVNSPEAKEVVQTPPAVQAEPVAPASAEETVAKTGEADGLESAEDAAADATSGDTATPEPDERDAETDERGGKPAAEGRTDPLAVAERTLAPIPQDAPFVPVPRVGGTATVPSADSPRISGYQVAADGKPSTTPSELPVGAYNLLKAPYDDSRPSPPSVQDRAGRGLGIDRPPRATDGRGRYWGECFPAFMGHKTDMADRTSQAIRRNMTRAERGHYTTVVDYFGGGGCWGLYHALTNLPNANRLVVNEYDADRLGKIRLLHEIGERVAEIAEGILRVPERYERLKAATGDSSSPRTIARNAESLFMGELTDPTERAAFKAFVDCASTMIGTVNDENGRTIKDMELGIRKAISALAEDGRKAKEAADAFRERGGTIEYRNGDAANWPDAPHGDTVMAVFDPPYYRTESYGKSGKVPLDAGGEEWDYLTTLSTLRRLVDAGDAIVYTDEAWWNRKDYEFGRTATDMANDLFAEQAFSDAQTNPLFLAEQETLLGIVNLLDHFDVAGRVVGRQETLGINHGHEVRKFNAADADGGPESGAGGGDAQLDAAADAGGERADGLPVGEVAAVAEGAGGAARAARGGGGRASAGERALARELVAATLTDELERAAPPGTPDGIAAEAVRNAVRRIPDERLVPFAREVRHSISRLYTGSVADYANRLPDGTVENPPSLAHVGSGEGAQAFGWGLYASAVRGVAEEYEFTGSVRRWIRENPTVVYRREMPPMKRGSIYEQTFFTDRAPGDESHLLNWYEPVGEEQLGWILRQAEKEGLVDKFESEKKFRGFRGDFRQFITDEGQSAESVYEQLSESGLAHSDDKYRDTSEFLARAGIDGVKYPVNTMSGAPKDGDGVRFNYVSFRDDNIRVDHKWTDGEQRYSVSRNPDARREVEDALAKGADGRYTGRANADIVFSDALPPALIACGIPDGRVYTRGYVLRKLEREHALDADGIMAVSQAMESPAAVLSDAAGGGYIVLTDHETRDKNGRVAPVMVYLRPDGRGNYIASAYAKTENGERQFTNLINSGNLLFANRERVAGLSLTGEVKSSFESARTGDAGSIPYGGADSQGGEPRHSVRRDELALHDDPQREYDEVVARFTNEDGTRKPGWMEAPNGEPTNLTERQWVQVRTPAFKRWFGDWEGDPANASKVVDENGEPLVVYHDSGERHNILSRDFARKSMDIEAVFFHLKQDKYHEYGNVEHAAFLNIRNPANFTQAHEGFEYGVTDDAGVRQREKLQSEGFDGAIFDAETMGGDELAEALVFDSRQIKSATENTGAFDASDPDIRYSVTQGRGNGYHGYSMSNNAVEAYDRGEMPKSKWTKAEIIKWTAEIDPEKAKLLKDIPLAVLRLEALRRTAWHHSSSWYNEVDFYGIDEGFVENLNKERAAQLAAMKVNDKPSAKVYKGDFDYITWSGTRYHPKAEHHHLENVIIEERGSFYYVTKANGEVVKKKIGSTGTRATDYDAAAKLEEEIAIAKAKVRRFTTDSARRFLGLHDYYDSDGKYNGTYFERTNFSISRDENVYVKGRKPTHYDYDSGLENFLKPGEQRAVKNQHGGYSMETWNGKVWVREDESGLDDLAHSTQVPDADSFVRDAVMGMLAAAGDGKGAANAGGEGARPTPERASVRRGGSSVRIDDLAIGTLAQRILAGREPTVDDAGKFLAGFGLSRTVNAADALDRARRIAEANRERLKAAVERANPEVIGTLARANLADSMQSAMDSLVRGTAQAVDPEIGMRLKDAVAARDRRALMAAKGFTAAEMMARLPVNLAEAVMSVAELGRTPGEMARREEERKRREEEKAKKGENEAAAADADGYTPASDEIEPTDAQKRMVAELLDRAKFANEQAAREDERRKADAERRGAERRDGEDGDDGADGDREGTESALPEATVRRIAPVLTDRWLAAQFLIEWIGDEILKSHPEIPATGEMWKSPVAIRELKQTAVHILRQLAKDTLGSPSLNYARNLADHQINELESDVDTRTYRMVRRRIADVYETIHDNALRISRRRLVSRLIDGWRENGVSHPGIRQLTGARGRFSATTEEMRRRIDGRTEVYARKLIPLLTMSEEKLAAREAELERIVTGSPDETTAPDEETMREARDELAALKRFGGLVRRMPGEIADAADEILTDLGGRRQAFEQRRLEREERLKRTSDTLVAAITDRAAPRRTKPKGRFARFVESYQGNIGLEIRNLFRFCRDESKREAALNETQDVEAALSEAGSVYRTERMRSQAAIGDALKACYGNAARGVRHLTAERIPDDVAAACFGQNRGQVVTYGNLLQMYASVVQADYAENAREHGRDKQIEMMRNALTDGDVAFYAWAVGWYRDGRKTLSDAVESVTGVPVTSPGENYVPVRVSRPSEGFAADAIAWSPIPRALSRRVPHRLDFDEGANFFRILDEQADMRAQVIGYAQVGMDLRDSIAGKAVQDAARRSVGAADMAVVTRHLRDILVQDADRSMDERALDGMNYARAWIARFAISGNLHSALSQPASIPVWACVMLGKREIGLRRVAHYLTHVDPTAIAELKADIGYDARYRMGWTEEVQNALTHPDRKAALAAISAIYDKGMAPSRWMDGLATMWVAQGFYRDATAHYMSRGETEMDAKRKAKALTWAAVEATQQTGRKEYLNSIQRNGSVGKFLFMFRTAQILANSYLIQDFREFKAGTPGAGGRLARDIAIVGVIIPAYLTLANLAWAALMGGGNPPEDEDRWPQALRDFLWASVDNVTCPFVLVTAMADAGIKPLLGIESYGGTSSGIPAIDSSVKIVRNLVTAGRDLGKAFTAEEYERELSLEKLQADFMRILRDAAAPVRHGYQIYNNAKGGR